MVTEALTQLQGVEEGGEREGTVSVGAVAGSPCQSTGRFAVQQPMTTGSCFSKVHSGPTVVLLWSCHGCDAMFYLPDSDCANPG